MHGIIIVSYEAKFIINSNYIYTSYNVNQITRMLYMHVLVDVTARSIISNPSLMWVNFRE